MSKIILPNGDGTSKLVETKTAVKGAFDAEKPLERALRHEEEELLDRQILLDKAAPNPDTIAPDNSSQDKQHRHDFVSEEDSKKKNFDQKKYYFPEEFNALRRELEDYWPTFFMTVNPIMGMSPAHAMVFDAAKFIGMCNGATDLAEQLDTGNVVGVCKVFLNAFRQKRGVSKLQ